MRAECPPCEREKPISSIPSPSSASCESAHAVAIRKAIQMLSDAPLLDVPIPSLAMRPKETAKALGISARKLWEITADRSSGIPHVRFGKAIVYPLRELQDWLRDQIKKKGSSR